MTNNVNGWGYGNESGWGSGEGSGYGDGSEDGYGDGDGYFENKPSQAQLLKLKGKTLAQLLWIKRGYEL